jgi:signal transduction histidine kinase
LRFFTIKTKIILAYTVVFGILLVIFAAVIYHSTKEAAFLRLNTNLKSYSISLRTEIQDQLDDNSPLYMKKLSSIKAEGLTGERFELFNKTGKDILKDTTLSKIPLPDLSTLSEDSFLYEREKVDKHKYHVLWNKFQTENDSVYVLATAALANDVFEELDRLLYLFLIIIPAGLIITGFAAYFISKAAFKPITKMAETAQNISGENLDKRLEIPRANDEVKVLAETLNEMIERIDNTFRSQKRFVANASHEIKTPLTVIQTELEILEKRIKDTESAEGIKNALAEIENLTNLTNSLLTVAKLDASQTKLNRSFIRVDELIADCAQAMNQAALKKNIRINLCIEEAVETNADKEKLKSVFLNLIDNAIKYSFDNSSIKINLKKIFNNKINIEVIDNGCGIPPLEIPFIFNRFYRSDEIRGEIGGSGLGLAITKEIIDLHKGEIKAESKPGVMTVFTVSLPINIT